MCNVGSILHCPAVTKAVTNFTQPISCSLLCDTFFHTVFFLHLGVGHVLWDISSTDVFSNSLEVGKKLLLQVFIVKMGFIPSPIDIEWEVFSIHNYPTWPFLKPSSKPGTTRGCRHPNPTHHMGGRGGSSWPLKKIITLKHVGSGDGQDYIKHCSVATEVVPTTLNCNMS